MGSWDGDLSPYASGKNKKMGKDGVLVTQFMGLDLHAVAESGFDLGGVPINHNLKNIFATIHHHEILINL